MDLNDVQEEYEHVNNANDKIFRKILDNKEEAISIINRILKKEEVITAEQIEKYNSSYISNKLKNSEADIVYKVIKQNVFFLIEHQTKIDYSMPYRILKYEVEIIESVLINQKYNNKEYKYPLIIPIVLYTGRKKWNAHLELSRVQIRWNKEYKNKELSRYNIIDVNKLTDKELIEEKSLVSKMMLIEKSKTEKQLEKNLSKIISLKNVLNKEQKELFITIMQLVLRKKIGNYKTNEFINELGMEEKDMLAVLEMIDRENARIRNEGKVEGKIEGKKEGEKESKINIAKSMLKEKLPVSLISKVTGIKEKEIEKIDENT